MTKEISDVNITDWSVAFEHLMDKHFADDLALDSEYDERFGESDLLGTSSVLHLQALQEAALGNSAPARLLAETAIYFAETCLSMNEDTSIPVPNLAAKRANRTARVNREEHLQIIEAAEGGVDAALDSLAKINSTMRHRALENPKWLPYRLTLTRTYCYMMQIHADIAQDRFRGTDPTIHQRNKALWQATDMVDRLLVTRDKEEIELFLSKEFKLQLATFAFDLISAYEPPKAGRELLLKVKFACFQDLLETVKDETYYGKFQQGSEGHQLSQNIGMAIGKIAREQLESGLKNDDSYKEVLCGWRSPEQVA